MQFLIKHTSPAGARTEQLVTAASSSEALVKTFARLGDAVACVCLCVSRMNPAQRAQLGA